MPDRLATRGGSQRPRRDQNGDHLTTRSASLPFWLRKRRRPPFRARQKGARSTQSPKLGLVDPGFERELRRDFSSNYWAAIDDVFVCRRFMLSRLINMIPTVFSFCAALLSLWSCRSF